MKEGYQLIYKRPKPLLTTRMHYCPGCFHSTIHKFLMEVVEELDMTFKTKQSASAQ
jgi:2-oxoglutarate ferredoxin oxidoreductase subunit beta